MAQSTTNLGKIHVFPSETLYNQFKDIIADNDLALLKDDGAYIVAALLEQNGYVKFSNGLILQWGYHERGSSKTITYPLAMTTTLSIALASVNNGSAMLSIKELSVDGKKFALWYHDANQYNFAARWIALGI